MRLYLCQLLIPEQKLFSVSWIGEIWQQNLPMLPMQEDMRIYLHLPYVITWVTNSTPIPLT